MLETLSFVDDEHHLLFRLRPETFAEFVESAKPPHIVANLTEVALGAASVDVIRCRFRTLTEHDSCDIPVFCPAELVDYSAKSPNKTVTIALSWSASTFSRFMHIELLKTKEAEEVTEAFLRIQQVARGRLAGKTRVVPGEVSSDTGAELKGHLNRSRRSRGVDTASTKV